MPSCQPVNTSRIFAAADVLLRAINSPAGNAAMVSLYIDAVHPRRSPPPWVFTHAELNEALDFLVRLGLARRTPPARSAIGVQARHRRC